MRWRVAGLCLAALTWGCAGGTGGPDEVLPQGQLGCAPGDGGTVCRVEEPFRHLPDIDLVIVEAPDERAGRASALRLFHERDDERILLLPEFYGSANWGWCELIRDAAGNVLAARLAIVDFNGDERDDIALAAECMTGIGPTGAMPFLAGALWFADAAGGYTTNATVNARFTELLAQRCTDAECDVAVIATAARAPGR